MSDRVRKTTAPMQKPNNTACVAFATANGIVQTETAAKPASNACVSSGLRWSRANTTAATQTAARSPACGSANTLRNRHASAQRRAPRNSNSSTTAVPAQSSSSAESRSRSSVSPPCVGQAPGRAAIASNAKTTHATQPANTIQRIACKTESAEARKTKPANPDPSLLRACSIVSLMEIQYSFTCACVRPALQHRRTERPRQSSSRMFHVKHSTLHRKRKRRPP